MKKFNIIYHKLIAVFLSLFIAFSVILLGPFNVISFSMEWAVLGGLTATEALEGGLFATLMAGLIGSSVDQGLRVDDYGSLYGFVGPSYVSSGALSSFLAQQFAGKEYNGQTIDQSLIDQVVSDYMAGNITIDECQNIYDQYLKDNVKVDPNAASSCINIQNIVDAHPSISRNYSTFSELGGILNYYDLSVRSSKTDSNGSINSSYRIGNSVHFRFASQYDHSKYDHVVSMDGNGSLSQGFEINAQLVCLTVTVRSDGSKYFNFCLPFYINNLYYDGSYYYNTAFLRGSFDTKTNSFGSLTKSVNFSYFCKRTYGHNGQTSNTSGFFKFADFQKPILISNSLPTISEYDDLDTIIDSLLATNVIDLPNSVNFANRVSSKDIADSDVAVFPPGNYSLEDLYKVLEGISGKDYSSVNEYVTDARSYITINEGDHTTINEGDDVVINHTYDDSNLLSSLGSWFESVLSYLSSFASSWATLLQSVASIGDDIPSIKARIKDIADDIPSIGQFLGDIAGSVADIPGIGDLLEDVFGVVSDIPDFLQQILDELTGGIDIVWPEVLPWELDIPDIVWPWELDSDWTIPIAWPWDLDSDWTIPIAWPTSIPFVSDKPIPVVVEGDGSISTPFEIDWPSVYPIDWERLFDWLCPDVSSIDLPSFDDTIGMPVGMPMFKGNIIDPFVSRYSNVDYPVFKITTPDILKKFYPSGEIILLDTSNHADLFSKVRYIIKFCLIFGLVLYLIKRAQHLFTYDDALDGGSGGFYLSK